MRVKRPPRWLSIGARNVLRPVCSCAQAIHQGTLHKEGRLRRECTFIDGIVARALTASWPGWSAAGTGRYGTALSPLPNFGRNRSEEVWRLPALLDAAPGRDAVA